MVYETTYLHSTEQDRDNFRKEVTKEVLTPAVVKALEEPMEEEELKQEEEE
jgi:hypothetical protein